MLKIFNKSQKKELTDILYRRANNVSPEIIGSVISIISEIRAKGDTALRDFTKRFDGVEPESFRLPESERLKALSKVSPGLSAVMERAALNIFAFHEKQKQYGRVDFSDGKVMGQRVLPLKRVGLYVPGGTAAYPSSVLMNAIPAKVAGVKEIVMVTPPKKDGINPAVVKAAEIAGVTDIITAGGAQAIAALAYGTESIKRVDKIVGPGNIYVATAKRLVFGAVDIDMIAGPSEVLIIADENAVPSYIAADLMAQAEHDPMAAAILISTSEKLIAGVNDELERQLPLLERSETIKRSLSDYGLAITVDTLEEAAEISDEIAPEHLELMVKNPFDLLGLVNNAGSVFLGENSPEPLGDYYAGPNHVLPTNGTARFSSALSVDSFVKKSSFLYYSKDNLEKAGRDVIEFAESEGLGAHANSVKVRMK